MKNDFVHLNFHSEYSLLESCCSIDKVKSECLEHGYEALALTDTGNISGAIKFYKECTKTEDKEGKPLKAIKPIIGSQMFICEDITKKEERDYSPIILLAKNNDGFKNLEMLSHISHVDGFYYKPRIDYSLLGKYSKDIICISTDLNGSVQRCLRRNKIDEALVEAEKFKNIFGSDYYLEVQNNAQSDQEMVNRNILEIAKKLGTDVIATNDVRYYKKDHYLAHLVLQANKDRKTIRSDKFTAVKTKERYFKSIEEMKLAFKDYPVEVLSNTVKIAEQCNVVFKFGGMRLPKIDIPNGFKNEWEYLKFLAFNGLKERGFAGRQEYIDRLEDELFDVKMVYETSGYNFARYFLMVWDYVNQARQNNCRIGVGRGSACGSLLLYTLHVTNVDPIKHQLYWWRFLTVDKKYSVDEESLKAVEEEGNYKEEDFIKSLVGDIKQKIKNGDKIDTDLAFKEIEYMSKKPFCLESVHNVIKRNKTIPNAVNSYLLKILGLTTEDPRGEFEPKLNFSLARVSHPDIDVDFDFFYRDKTYDYLIEKYGRERSGNIGTYQRLKAKNAIRTTIKALDPLNDKDKSFELENYVADLIPDDPKVKIAACIEENSELQRISKKYPDIFEIAKTLEGICSHPSMHAAGIVISDVPLMEIAPLHRTPSGGYATQFEMAELEEMGLIKFDILALKTLSVFDMMTKDLKNDLDIDLNIDKIDLEDKKALRLIARGETDTVFQLEGRGMKELLKSMRVSTFNDVAAANALHRPGAMEAEADQIYCRCKHGEMEVVYDHPKLKDILESTYGQIVYQEQCQLIAMKIAGFSIKEADSLRKAIGKKKPELMAKLRKKFVIGAKIYSNMDERKATDVFRKIESMGGYGFCFAHAVAYGVLACQCAYLKAHYPVYYMKEFLNVEMLDGKIENVDRYMKECINMKIKILPCNINKSKATFTIDSEKSAIRRGLASFKGVGEKSSVEIEQLAPFKDLEEFIEKTIDIGVINKTTIEVLMQNGAFTCFDLHGEDGLNKYLELKKHIKNRREKNIQKSSMFDFSGVSFK